MVGSSDDQMTSPDSYPSPGVDHTGGDINGRQKKGHQNNAKIFTMNSDKNSSLFSYVPGTVPPPRLASAYIGTRDGFKRDGAIAPNLRNFSPPISIQLSQKMYYTTSSSNAASTAREDSSNTFVISSNESALKLPSPPHVSTYCM